MNADIERTPSPSPPELHSHSSRRRHSEEARVLPSSYSVKQPVVVDMDVQESSGERESDGMVAEGSRRHHYPSWKSKELARSRKTPKVGTCSGSVL